MNYIRGDINILSDIANLKRFGYYYSASLDEIPSDVLDMHPTKITSNYITDGITVAYTTKVPNRVIGQYCVFAFPKSCGSLTHIYCGDLNIDLLDVPEQEETWKHIDILVNKIPYELWYQDHTTKDINLAYKFVFDLGGRK